MLNKDNLLTITEKGYEFIVGERLKNLPKKLQAELSDPKTTKIVYELDQNKIDRAAQYDGLKAIATSDKSLSNEDMLLKYKELYKIEQTFRA